MRFKEYIAKDKAVYNRNDWYWVIRTFLLSDDEGLIWKCVKYLRKEEYYFAKHNMLLCYYYQRKKNRIQKKAGFVLERNTIGRGTKIWHHGVMIHSEAKVGENCCFHGNNCVGNIGRDEGAPTLGAGVKVGIGAMIIGNVELADGIIVGAGSVVNRSFLEPGITIAGVPARKIKDACSG